jgi:hypothetical protein
MIVTFISIISYKLHFSRLAHTRTRKIQFFLAFKRVNKNKMVFFPIQMNQFGQKVLKINDIRDRLS